MRGRGGIPLCIPGSGSVRSAQIGSATQRAPSTRRRAPTIRRPDTLGGFSNCPTAICPNSAFVLKALLDQCLDDSVPKSRASHRFCPVPPIRPVPTSEAGAHSDKMAGSATLSDERARCEGVPSQQFGPVSRRIEPRARRGRVPPIEKRIPITGGDPFFVPAGDKIPTGNSLTYVLAAESESGLRVTQMCPVPSVAAANTGFC
jgi:hypothetical protein